MAASPDAITEHAQPLLKSNERIEQLWELTGDRWLLVTDRNILTLSLTNTHEIKHVESYPSGAIQELSVSASHETSHPYHALATGTFFMSIITAVLGAVLSTGLYLVLFAGAGGLALAGAGLLVLSRRTPDDDITTVTITLEEGRTHQFRILGEQTQNVLKSRLRQTF